MPKGVLAMDVLVTGGAGYIGSTICSALADRGDTPIILDSLVTGDLSFRRDFPFYQGDITQSGLLAQIRSDFPKCETVIHCAARIIVSESMADPYLYFRENVSKSIDFLKLAIEFGIDKIIFSSSASVYGTTSDPEVTEYANCNPASPYAHSKLMIEKVIEAYSRAYDAKALSLRYFNPIGADPKLRTGQQLKNPSHLLGRLLDTMRGKYPCFEIFGDDWPTRDGTAIRDYTHVWDLAAAHLAAVDYLHSESVPPGSCEKINIGTGNGTTVKEFVDAFQVLAPVPISVQVGPRREGDIIGAYASANRAQALLNWKARRSISEGIEDSMRWLSNLYDKKLNPRTQTNIEQMDV